MAGMSTSGRCGRASSCRPARCSSLVIDSKTNIVEHPDLVAQRIIRFADAVGRENVIASTDCGFGTFASNYQVHPRITWLKLRALAEGADTASRQLWDKAERTPALA
jgi:hypothetical protein